MYTKIELNIVSTGLIKRIIIKLMLYENIFIVQHRSLGVHPLLFTLDKILGQFVPGSTLQDLQILRFYIIFT